MKVQCENLNTIRSAMHKNKTLRNGGQDYITGQTISKFPSRVRQTLSKSYKP